MSACGCNIGCVALPGHGRTPSLAVMQVPFDLLDIKMGLSGEHDGNQRVLWSMRQAHLLRMCMAQLRTAAN